jgi:HK97 gp10 family phage protein
MTKDFDIVIKYDHFDELARKAKGAVRDIVRKAAFDVEANAKNVVPVDTGNLKNSIDVEMESDTTAVIGPHTEYAAYVEFGTMNMPAQPYMTPAAEAVKPAYMEAMRQLEDRLK